jgi:hypothetical protein
MNISKHAFNGLIWIKFRKNSFNRFILDEDLVKSMFNRLSKK